jgi:hypothetical protein
MPVPQRWEDVLNGPAYVINLDSRPDRFAKSAIELERAGFHGYRRFAAVEAREGRELDRGWSDCGSPRFAAWDTRFRELPGKQGCFLSHVMLWQEIVENNLAFACVFEDDVVFHRHWSQLAPTAFAFTPPDYDVLFMGSQIEVKGHGLVQRVPVHCLHAYVITLEGAQQMRSLLLNDPEGVGSIDVMIIRHQWLEHAGTRRAPFDWYAWNGTTFTDSRAMGNPAWEKRNSGLVFQNFALGSDIESFTPAQGS